MFKRHQVATEKLSGSFKIFKKNSKILAGFCKEDFHATPSKKKKDDDDEEAGLCRVVLKRFKRRVRQCAGTQSVPTFFFTSLSNTLSFQPLSAAAPTLGFRKGCFFVFFCCLPAPTVFTNSYGQQLPILHGLTPLTSEQCVGLLF